MAAKKGIEIDQANYKQAVAPFLDARCQQSLDASYCRVIPKLIGLHEKMSEFLASVESNEGWNTTSPRPACDQNPVRLQQTANLSPQKSNPTATERLLGSNVEVQA